MEHGMFHTPDFDVDTMHRWFGVECNNAIFPLLEKVNRTREETEEMIALAYAATVHWKKFSGHTIANSVRGENMIATALTYAGRKEGSLHHAKRNYDMVVANRKDVKDFDVTYAYMVMARSLALNGAKEEAQEFYDKCKASIEAIQDDEDKNICRADFEAGPWYGLRS